MLAVKEALRRDVVADRARIANMRRQHARERMLPDEQQLEDHHREAEEIVVRQPIDAREIAALQFGRLVLRDADVAAQHRAVVRDLEAIAIDQVRARIAVHEDVARVHVADDDVAAVQHLERARQIDRGVDQELPMRVGEEVLTALGPDQIVQRALRGEQRHREADGPRALVEHRERPGRDRTRASRRSRRPSPRVSRSAASSAAARRVSPTTSRLLERREDRALTALAELLGQRQDGARRVLEFHPSSAMRQPIASDLSSSVRRLIAGGIEVGDQASRTLAVRSRRRRGRSARAVRRTARTGCASRCSEREVLQAVGERDHVVDRGRNAADLDPFRGRRHR